MSRIAHWAPRVALGIASFALVLLGLEIALRIVDPYGAVPGLAMYHPTRANQLVPGFRGNWRGPVYVNSLGFRDREGADPTTVEKPAGTMRVMLFGDSFTFGSEHPVEDSFPYLTERRLEALDSSHRWQVINAGVPGYLTVQEALYIKETVDQFRPDLVVLEYTLNDAQEYEARGPDTGVRALLRGPAEWLRARSYAFHFFVLSFEVVRDRVSTSRAAPAADARRFENALRERYEARYAPASPHFATARRALIDVDRTLAERGVPLIVAIYPDIVRMDQGLATSVARPTYRDVYPLADIHAQVADVVRGGQGRILDLLDVLGPLPHAEVYEGSDHPGPNANRHVAAALAERILAVLASPAQWTVGP